MLSLQLSSGIACACAILVCVLAWSDLSSEDGEATDELAPAQERALRSLIRVCGVVVWPALLLSVVPPNDRCVRVLAVPLGWVALMAGLEGYLSTWVWSSRVRSAPAIQYHPSNFTGLFFGVAGLLGMKQDAQYVNLFLIALMALILTVLPEFSLPPGSMHDVLLRSLQSTLLVMAVGLMVAGVTLTRQHVKCDSPEKPG